MTNIYNTVTFVYLTYDVFNRKIKLPTIHFVTVEDSSVSIINAENNS